MKKTILLFISVILLILPSCSQKPIENESDYTAFLNMLADSKFQYTEGDLDTCVFRRHPDTDFGNIRTAYRNDPDSVSETSGHLAWLTN